MTVPASLGGILQPGERVVALTDLRVDVRSHATNAEVPVPWADLAKPRHYGSIVLTSDRLLIIFNPGNARVVSVPLPNVLMAWERACEGRKQHFNQVVFVLPSGMFCVCELEGCDVEPITALRLIVHAVTRTGNFGARDGVNAAPDYYLGDDSGLTAAIASFTI